MAENRNRNARVEIGKADDGRPSIKVEGVEMSFLIGDDIALKFIREDGRGSVGHWELGVTFIDPVLTLDMAGRSASVRDLADLKADLAKLRSEVVNAARSGRRRGKR